MRVLIGLLTVMTIATAGASGDVFSAAGPGTFDSSVPLISEVNFSDDELIVDLDIQIQGLEYPWAGDLTLTLTSPIGTEFQLVERLGKSDFNSATDSGNSVDFRGDYTFSDDGDDIGLASVDTSSIPAGDYRATTARGETLALVDVVAYESTLGTWTLLIEDFDEEDGGTIAGGTISTRSVADPVCDFNGDGSCDIQDLDGPNGLYQVGDLALGVPVESETDANDIYDILQNGRVDVGDLNLWRAAAAHRNGFAQGYRPGDSDLNGTVNFSDFLRLSANFGTGQLWSDGNPRGSGTTGFSDFLSLSNDFGNTLVAKPAFASNVPEPLGGCSLLFGLAIVVLWNRPVR